MIGYVKLFSILPKSLSFSLASTQRRMALYFKLYFIYSMLLQCFADIGKSFAVVCMLLLIQCTILITLVGHVSFINVSIQLSVKSNQTLVPHLPNNNLFYRTCMNVIYTSISPHISFRRFRRSRTSSKCRCVTKLYQTSEIAFFQKADFLKRVIQ